MDDLSKWSGKASTQFKCNIVLVSGLDWNKDMSPWPCDGVMKKEKSFAGGAAMFLKELTEDYVPAVEQWLKVKPTRRCLAGVSMSGLFALWAISRTAIFDRVASISGSLWFDGFAEWVEKTALVPGARIYITLGSKEKNANDKRLATVEDCTKKTVAQLESKGFDVTFEMVSGTHFSPVAPRLDRALTVLMPYESVNDVPFFPEDI